MSEQTDQYLVYEDYAEGRAIDDKSLRTPIPSTPDTCVTSTISCETLPPYFLYGDFEMSEFKDVPQLTLAIIKPDGMEHLHEINTKIREWGFDIVNKRRVWLTPEQVSEFYSEHCDKAYFPILVTTMSAGPSQVYVLRRKDAVYVWRLLCGPACVIEAKGKWPESLRALYGTPDGNVCHGSENEEKAKLEIKFFFPDMILDANFRNKTEVEDYINEFVNPVLADGLSQVCRTKPMDPVVWLGKWLLLNNPNKPKMIDKIAMAPT